MTTVGTSDTGLQIRAPQVDAIRVNTSYGFKFHVFNLTNGVPIISEVACYLHIYNASGSHIYRGEANSTDDVFDYEFNVHGMNFSAQAFILTLPSAMIASRAGSIQVTCQ